MIAVVTDSPSVWPFRAESKSTFWAVVWIAFACFDQDIFWLRACRKNRGGTHNGFRFGEFSHDSVFVGFRNGFRPVNKSAKVSH